MMDMPHNVWPDSKGEIHWAQWLYQPHPHDRAPLTWFVSGHVSWNTLYDPWTYVVLPPVKYDEYGSIIEDPDLD